MLDALCRYYSSLRADADTSAHLRGIAVDGLLTNEHPPGIRLEQTAHHRDGGGLSRAVGAEEAEDLTFINLQGKSIHGRQVTVALGQLFDSEYGGQHKPLS